LASFILSLAFALSAESAPTSLPQLDDVDDILQRGDMETDQSDELWPCEALQQGKRGRDGKGNGRGHPVSEVEGDKEEFVSGTDEEQCCLTPVKSISQITMHPLEPRRHPPKKIKVSGRSCTLFSFVLPVLFIIIWYYLGLLDCTCVLSSVTRSTRAL